MNTMNDAAETEEQCLILILMIALLILFQIFLLKQHWIEVMIGHYLLLLCCVVAVVVDDIDDCSVDIISDFSAESLD